MSRDIDLIEQTLHPEGRCAKCGGGKPYWKHDMSRHGSHPFTATPRPTADTPEPLTEEEEAEVRRLDSLFDAANPNDYARPEWLVGLLVERRRLLATLDAARADRGSSTDPLREAIVAVGHRKLGKLAGDLDGVNGLRSRHFDNGTGECASCLTLMPCDGSVLLDMLDAALAGSPE